MKIQKTLDIFATQAHDIAKRAFKIVNNYQHSEADTEHFLLAIMEQPNDIVSNVLKHFSIEQSHITSQLEQTLLVMPKRNKFTRIFANKNQIVITRRFTEVLKNATEEIINMGDECIDIEHLFLAICREKNTTVAKILQTSGLQETEVRKVIEGIRSGEQSNN